MADRGSHLNDMTNVQRLIFNEIAMLKREHETKQVRMHRRLEEVKRRSRNAAVKNRDNVPLDFSSAKSRYDNIRRQSKRLKDFMDFMGPQWVYNPIGGMGTKG